MRMDSPRQRRPSAAGPTAPDPGDPAVRRRALLAALALVAASAAVYVPSLGGGFVFDDHVLVGDTALLRGPLSGIWLSADATDYWPLTSTTFWLEWRLWGANPLPYRIANLGLHAAVVVLLWRTLRRLSAPGAWLASLLYAVHPVAVESVAWISERKNVLSGVLFLSAALAWLRFRESGRRGAAAATAGLFLLALLAKTSTVMLPVVLLGETLVRGWRRPDRERRWLAALFALAAAFGAVTLWFQWNNSMGGLGLDRSPAERLAGAGWAWATYLWTAFQPFAAAVLYAPRPLPAAAPLTWAPLAALLVGAVLLWRARRGRARPAALALGYHLVLLLPVLGLVDMSFLVFSPVGNHLQYLALMGPAALAGGALARAGAALGPTPAAAAAGLVAATLAAHAGLRARAYGDDVSLWSRGVREAPQSLTASRLLAGALADAGRPADALASLASASARLEDRPASLRAEALRLSQVGKEDDAYATERTASALAPDLVFQYELAVILSRGGRPDLAVPLLSELAARQPRTASNHYELASALARTGRLAEATEAARRSCRLAPRRSGGCAGLAMLLARQGRAGDARGEVAAAMGLPPASPAVDRVLRTAFPGGRP